VIIIANMAAVMVAMLTLLTALGLLQRRWLVHPEVPRKLMHVGMGLIVLSLPWLFPTPWPVVALSAAAVVLLLLIRLTRLRKTLGGVMGSVDRFSLGDIYFPISVAVLAWLSWDRPALFCIPVLVLTLGDSIAAVLGLSYGRMRYTAGDGFKSIEGSMAFFIITLMSVHVPLLLATSIGRVESLLVATIVALLVTLLEAMAWRGVDNLFVPLGTFVLLDLYQAMPAAQLTLRLSIMLAIAAFVLAWRWRTTLDDAALVAVVLYGYVLALAGGWAWLVAPATLFMLCLVMFPYRAGVSLAHPQAVVAVAFASLVSIVLSRRFPETNWLTFHALATAAHFAFIHISNATQPQSPSAPSRWITAAGLATLLIAFPTIAISGDQWVQSTGLAFLPIVVSSALFAAGFDRLRRAGATAVHTAGAMVAAAAAAVWVLLA
jgi:phytol kinase